MPPKPSTRPGDRRRLADIRALHTAGFLEETDDDGALRCILPGPPDTAYAGYDWRVRISLPREYPFKSPSVGFEDRVYHPNVEEKSGSICVNVLNSEWTPVYNLVTILQTLLPQLLTYPNPDDPMNAAAARLWTEDPEAFRRKVVEVREG